MNLQTTIQNEIIFSGIGLHSGKEVHMKLLPAGDDEGIFFLRSDLKNTPIVKATADHVMATMRATTIQNEEGIKFFTIEHLMSALNAFDIDNCRIELDAEEPPVADGASLVFLKLLQNAGKKFLSKPQKKIFIDKILRVDSVDNEGDKNFILIVPWQRDELRISFMSVNPHKLIGEQYFDFVLNEKNYENEIAPARTIAYEKEIQALRQMGLGLGGTLENVIVYNDEGWINPLRFSNELVRHKILDVIGDLRLAGKISGHVIAVKSSHNLNTQLAKKILAEYQ